MPTSLIMRYLSSILLLAATNLSPQSADPPLFNHLQHNVRKEAINDCADAQCHKVHLGVFVESIQVKHLLSSLNGALSIDSLPILASKFQTAQRKWRHVSDSPLYGRQVVPGLQEIRNIEGKNTSHDLGDTEEYGHAVDRESRVGEESVESDTETLAATGDAERVESYDKVCLCVTL